MLLWIKELTFVCHFFLYGQKCVCQIQFLCFSDKPETPWLGVFSKRIISFSDCPLEEENQFETHFTTKWMCILHNLWFLFLNSAQNYYRRNHRRTYPPPASWSIFLAFPPHGQESWSCRAAKSANSREAPSVCGLCKWCINVIMQHGGLCHLLLFSPKSLKTTI